MGSWTPVTVSVEGIDGLRRLRQVLTPKLYEKAAAAGLRQAGRAVATQIAKDIRSRYTISSARVKQDIRGPYQQGDSAVIMASKKPPTLNQFRFKPGRRGGPQPGLGRGRGWGPPSTPGKPATAQVLRGRGAVPIKGAFEARGLPMQRIAKGRGRGTLKVLKGPSIARIYAGRGAFGRELRSGSRQVIERAFDKGFEKVIRDAERGYGRV